MVNDSKERRKGSKEDNDNNNSNNNNNNDNDNNNDNEGERSSNTLHLIDGDYNNVDSAGVQEEPTSVNGDSNQNKQHETYLSLESQNGGIRNSEVGEREISQNIHTNPITEPPKPDDPVGPQEPLDPVPEMKAARAAIDAPPDGEPRNRPESEARSGEMPEQDREPGGGVLDKTSSENSPDKREGAENSDIKLDLKDLEPEQRTRLEAQSGHKQDFGAPKDDPNQSPDTLTDKDSKIPGELRFCNYGHSLEQSFQINGKIFLK